MNDIPQHYGDDPRQWARPTPQHNDGERWEQDVTRLRQMADDDGRERFHATDSVYLHDLADRLEADRADALAEAVEWAYNDACFTAPEDTERMRRQWRRMTEALHAYRSTPEKDE